MGNPESNDREIIVEAGQEIPEPTVDIKRYKLDKATIDRLVQVLAEKCPPGSDMSQWITGWDELGEGPKKHVVSRIYMLVLTELPEVKKNDIANNIPEIFAAYKKEITDATHIINTEQG